MNTVHLTLALGALALTFGLAHNAEAKPKGKRVHTTIVKGADGAVVKTKTKGKKSKTVVKGADGAVVKTKTKGDKSKTIVKDGQGNVVKTDSKGNVTVKTAAGVVHVPGGM